MADFYGQTIDPSQAGSAHKLLGRQDRRTRPDFRMLVHPERWIWDRRAGEYLPKLGKMKRDPGVQGVGVQYDSQGRPHIDDSHARSFYISKGWTIVENGAPSLAEAVDGGKYLSRWGARGGWAYGWVWEIPHDVAGVIEWESDDDTELSVKRHIKATMLNGEPDVRWKKLQIRQHERKIRRLTAKQATKSQYKEIQTNLDKAIEHLAVLKADLAKHDPPAPKPKKSKAPKADAEVTE